MVKKDDAKDFAKGISIKSDAGKKGFELIQSASLNVDGNVDGIKLTEAQLKKLKTYLKADKKAAETPCGYENYFECIQDDGAKFHFSISADGESISTDRSVYVVDYPDNVEIVELFKEIYKSTNR